VGGKAGAFEVIGREFTVQRLRADGEPLEQPRPLAWPDAFRVTALEWPREVPLQRLRHAFDLARAAPGHPVDAIAMHEDSIRYSARITHKGN
jgi:hypothetical protein